MLETLIPVLIGMLLGAVFATFALALVQAGKAVEDGSDALERLIDTDRLQWLEDNHITAMFNPTYGSFGVMCTSDKSRLLGAAADLRTAIDRAREAVRLEAAPHG